MFKVYGVTIDTEIPEKAMIEFCEYVRLFKKRNKMEFDLEIGIDYLLEDLGLYIFEDRKILVNPANCNKNDDTNSAKYYVNDYSVFGVLAHEFAHFLTIGVFEDFVDEYKNAFPLCNDRAIINNYANTEVREEIAEIVSLYNTNPYFLKLISPNHFKFIAQYFKPAIICSEKKFIAIYNSYPFGVKQTIKSKFGIDYDIELNKVLKFI